MTTATDYAGSAGLFYSSRPEPKTLEAWIGRTRVEAVNRDSRVVGTLTRITRAGIAYIADGPVAGRFRTNESDFVIHPSPEDLERGYMTWPRFEPTGLESLICLECDTRLTVANEERDTSVIRDHRANDHDRGCTQVRHQWNLATVREAEPSSWSVEIDGRYLSISRYSGPGVPHYMLRPAAGSPILLRQSTTFEQALLAAHVQRATHRLSIPAPELLRGEHFRHAAELLANQAAAAAGLHVDEPGAWEIVFRLPHSPERGSYVETGLGTIRETMARAAATLQTDCEVDLLASTAAVRRL